MAMGMASPFPFLCWAVVLVLCITHLGQPMRLLALVGAESCPASEFAGYVWAKSAFADSFGVRTQAYMLATAFALQGLGFLSYEF
jgi:hypothetical protein